MNKLPILLVLIISLLRYESVLAQKQNWPLISLINKVEYVNSSFNNDNAACGFLLKVNNDTFAVTAKHILLVAKTDSMNSVYFGNNLKSWMMSPKDKPHEIVLIDKLINEDKTDSLTWTYLATKRFNYNDWLVFSIKANRSKVIPLELRRTSIKYGEPLYVIGWTYADKEGMQRVYEYSYLGSYGTHFNMKLVNAPIEGKGLSGSPVIDSDGLLVGIISDGYFDSETRMKISSPCSTICLFDILAKMKYKK